MEGLQHHGSAFFPPTECFERLLGFERRDSAKERLDKLVDHLAQLNLDGDLEIALLASVNRGLAQAERGEGDAGATLDDEA